MNVGELKRYLEKVEDTAQVRVTAKTDDEWMNREAVAVQVYMYSNPSHDPKEPGTLTVAWIK